MDFEIIVNVQYFLIEIVLLTNIKLLNNKNLPIKHYLILE